MTAREVFEGMLVELSKVNAPSLLLKDFNYLFNKAINQYINKRYNVYDVAQQQTDDLRVLKATTMLTPKVTTLYTNDSDNTSGSPVGTKHPSVAQLFGATYEVELPHDYLHLLNCICIYKVHKQHKCYDKDTIVQFAAKRLTADSWSTIINDFYNRPLPERPYYYIHNVNKAVTIPTNGGVTDIEGVYKVTEQDGAEGDVTNLPRTLNIAGTEQSLIERNGSNRYGNASTVRMEIRYGKDKSVFELIDVFVDYIKAPQHIRLTQEQLDLTEDTSQVMEFPDYVCQEIINELTILVMENTADPRLQTHIPVTQSIANPAQAQAPQK